MFQDISGLFSRMGLKDRDIRVFLACVAAKEEGLFVHEMVKRTKIKRSTIDLVVKRLREQGFLTRIRVGSRYKFFSEPLESILFRQEQVAEDFRTLLPIIKKIGGEQHETQVRFFEGRDGIRKAYDSVLLSLKFAQGHERALLSFSSGTHMMKIYPEMQRAFIDKRVRLGAPYRVIAPSSSASVDQWASDPKMLRTLRVIDEKKFPFSVTFEIFADSLLVISPTKPIGAVIIRSQRVADSLRSLFEFVWSVLD